MTLPRVELPVEVVTLSDGQTVEVRGLTFAQYETLGAIEGGLETMYAATALATGASADEVRAWAAATPFEDVTAVVDAVKRLSNLDDPSGEASGGPSSSASGTPSPSSSPSESA